MAAAAPSTRTPALRTPSRRSRASASRRHCRDLGVRQQPPRLAGVLKSLQQALSGEKIPFARTPKVRDRTAAPALYVIVPYLIVLYSVITAWRSYHHSDWGNLAFAVFSAVLAAGAIRAYIGLRNSVVDLGLGVANWLMVPRAEG